MKQAPRAWFHRFSSFLLKLGFLSSQADSLLFVYHSLIGTIYLLLYVDDMVITGSKSHRLHFSLNDERCAMPFDRLHCDLWVRHQFSLLLDIDTMRYSLMIVPDLVGFSL